MSQTIDTNPPVDEAPPRRLVRVDEGRWLGGVSAGLGRYFDVNPLVYRIAFVALAFVGGTGLLLYLAAWLVIPAEDREESIAVEALRQHRERPWFLLGIGLLGLGAVVTISAARFWPSPGNVWLGATLVGAALVWWHVSQRERRPAPEAATTTTATTAAAAPAPRPRKPSLLLPVLGGLLAGAGFFGLLAVLDVYDVDVAVALAVAVVITGVAVVAGAATGRRVGGLVVVGLFLLAGFGAAASMPVNFSSGMGDRNERPLVTGDLESSYELGVGDFTLELSDLELPAGTTRVEAGVGIGELVVIVPEDAALVIDARAAAGRVDVLGREEDGFDASRRVVEPGATPDAPTLELDADVGFGNLEVRRG